MKTGVINKDKTIVTLSLRELISLYHLSNQAEGKSPKTTRWYDELLRALVLYLETKFGASDLEFFNIDVK
jgi:hypothetical protein